jgi:L-rhamnose mutarotase
MERHTFALQIHQGKMKEYRQLLGQFWPELTKALDQIEAKNFSIWNVEQIIFGYFETEATIKVTLESCPLFEKINKEMSHTYQWISKFNEPMRLMYYNYGVVRESKELINKNVFVTRLHDGMSDEYKKRHDVLVEKSVNRVNSGPISNFTIWNAGEYIFGYTETDTTMFRERTEEGKQHSIAWETKMLEIMDWITDDIDWITGEHHSPIGCIAHHN